MSVRTSIVATATALSLTWPAALLPSAMADPGADQAARSAPTWSPVRTLAPNPSSADLTVDGRGTTTFVWATTDYPARVVARQRFADGGWGPRTVLGEGGDPRVVADQRGVVTVLWVTQREGFSNGVASARRTPSRGWSQPTTLSRDVAVPGYVPGAEAYGASGLDAAVSPAGAVVAAWTWSSPDEGVATRIQSAYRPKPGAWRKAVDVTPANGADEPEVGIAADGTAIVVYGVQVFGEPQALAARVRGTGGRWGSSTPITAEGYDHHLAVAGDGRAVVVYSPDFSAVRAVFRSSTGRWGKPRPLVKGGELNDVDVAVNARGHFVVGMARDEGRVDVVERVRGGGWSDPVRLARKGTVASDVMVAIDNLGDVFVGWGEYGVYARYREHGSSTWSRRLTAWRDTGVDVLESAFAAMAPDGDVAVLWDQEEMPLRMRVLKTS